MIRLPAALLLAAVALEAQEPSRIFRIKPLRPVAELRTEAIALQPPKERGDFRKSDLVELAKLDPGIKLDIRYATTDNFLSTPVYTSARAFLQKPAAEALLSAHRDLMEHGYGLLIFDGYRPWYVTKIFWDATPADKHGFVADPSKGSKHNRGCAVDLSMYDLKTGREVEMPGVYDEMSSRSYPTYTGGTVDQRKRRDLLRGAMEKQGFHVDKAEWWHFDYKDWPHYGIQNIPFEEIHSAASGGPDLDGIVKRVIAQERVVGASVLVARGNRIILHQGYGFADLGLEAPAKDETVYGVVGPMMPFTGFAIMQQVERGKLSLDDDISKFIPEFPLQGHRVSVRQLLNHTSGIVDYHYLGDAIEATSRTPKALDEVMALYSGKRWVNEPGTKWDWSISGFQLLVTILERVSGQSYDDYLQHNILKPSGTESTTYCDDFTLVRGLSHAYRKQGQSHVPAHENGMAYNTDLRYCSTVGDLYRSWRAVQEKKLVRPETLKMMSTAEGATMHMSAQDPKMHYGLALTLNHEDEHRSFGQHGSLLGYSGCLYEFPADDQLTVVVLTNTEGQNAYAIARALARAELGLPELPRPSAPAPEKALSDKPVSAGERVQLAGTYSLKVEALTSNLHDSFAQYRRTYRVFDENGRLMIQALGQGAERLLKQEDGSFAMRSVARSRISFSVQDGHAVGMRMDSQGGGLTLAGQRAGDGDPQTFHQQLR